MINLSNDSSYKSLLDHEIKRVELNDVRKSDKHIGNEYHHLNFPTEDGKRAFLGDDWLWITDAGLNVITVHSERCIRCAHYKTID